MNVGSNSVLCWFCHQKGHVRRFCDSLSGLNKLLKLAGPNPSCNFSSHRPTTSVSPPLPWFTGVSVAGAGPEPNGPTVLSSPQDAVSGELNGAPGRAPSSSPPSLFTPQGNPNSSPPLADGAHELAGGMAFLNIDPEPMMLAGFSRVRVEGRQKFARVVTDRAVPANEDLAIVSITNLPAGEIPFTDIRAAILDLVEGRYELRVTDIQRCPLGRGQAYIRLSRASDRDSLVHHSPHLFHGLSIDFVNHDRGPNARRVLFNRECWLMLIGYPVDDHSLEDIKNAIKSFGRLILWQKDNVLGRIIIKARVTDLVDVPHYLILSEGEDFEGISYTVQCEIIQQNLLGGQLPDEDIPPGGFDDDEFVFPGIDQAQHFGQFFGQLPAQGNANNNLIAPLIPDLNNLPMDAEQNIDLQEDAVMEEIIEQQEGNEEEHQHDELDLQLSISAPNVSSSESVVQGSYKGPEGALMEQEDSIEEVGNQQVLIHQQDQVQPVSQLIQEGVDLQ